MRRLAAGAAALGVLLLAAPAHAENPVLDPADDTDVAASLAEATDVQGVCYGYTLRVDDGDTGRYSGTYATSNAGAGTAVSQLTSGCEKGTVDLDVKITYTSSYSEAEDSAGWSLITSLPGLQISDLEDLGLSAGDLLHDGKSATTLLNAVQALPRLASEQSGLPPLVLEENTQALPADATPTGTPGSDWLRQNGALLFLCVTAIAGGIVALLASRRRPPGSPPRFTSFGPPPRPGPRSTP